MFNWNIMFYDILVNTYRITIGFWRTAVAVWLGWLTCIGHASSLNPGIDHGFLNENNMKKILQSRITFIIHDTQCIVGCLAPCMTGINLLYQNLLLVCTLGGNIHLQWFLLLTFFCYYLSTQVDSFQGNNSGMVTDYEVGSKR